MRTKARKQGARIGFTEVTVDGGYFGFNFDNPRISNRERVVGWTIPLKGEAFGRMRKRRSDGRWDSRRP